MAQQAVGVFVAAPLPRRVGIAEVDLHTVATVPWCGAVSGPGSRSGTSSVLRQGRVRGSQRVGDHVSPVMAARQHNSIRNPVERSTNVATGLIRLPNTRSPSQWPGAAGPQPRRAWLMSSVFGRPPRPSGDRTPWTPDHPPGARVSGHFFARRAAGWTNKVRSMLSWDTCMSGSWG